MEEAQPTYRNMRRADRLPKHADGVAYHFRATDLQSVRPDGLQIRPTKEDGLQIRPTKEAAPK